MGDLVYSHDYVNSSLGYTYHYEHILDDDAEILESVETPFTLQFTVSGQQITMQLYRSGYYFVDTQFIIFIIANKETYLRRYQNGVEDSWTKFQETNGDGAYAYLAYIRIDGQYYPRTESGTYTDLTTNFYVNPIVHQLNTLSDYYDWVTNSAPLGGTVVVDYQFPEGGSYEYAKIVFKKNRIPANVNDGYAVDIDPTATSVQVEGISKTLGTKYYFAIFTDKSVSDEFVYEVTEPIPRFSMAKKFKTDNGTFNYNIPSWIEDRVLSVLESDPTTTTIHFDVENYPAVANLYEHQFVEYPLQFRTHYGTYPETGSRPATSNYIAKDYKLEWLWTSGSSYRDETDYLKTNGEWVSVYTQGSGRSRADNNYESFVAEMFILDHIEKKGYPAYFSWAHSENWSGRKYQCQITKMGTGSRYADLATAIYNALK